MQYRLIFAWQLRSSEYYLHARVLSGYGDRAAEVYNTISSALSQIYFEKHLDTNVSKMSFRDGEGRDVLDYSKGGNEKGLDYSADAAASYINWLTYRSAFYTTYGALKNYYACPHPIRSSFMYAIAKSEGILSNIAEASIIEFIGSQGAETTMHIKKLSDASCASLDLPWFSAWIAANSKGPDTIIETAFALRDEAPVRALRRRLDDLEAARLENNFATYSKLANKTVSQAQSAARDVKALYGLSNQQGLSTSGIALAANAASVVSGVTLPAVPEVRFPGLGLAERLRLAFGFRALFRRIVDDLVAVSRLGALHDKLLSGIRKHPKARPRQVFKREDPRYRYAESHWKRPME